MAKRTVEAHQGEILAAVSRPTPAEAEPDKYVVWEALRGGVEALKDADHIGPKMYAKLREIVARNKPHRPMTEDEFMTDVKDVPRDTYAAALEKTEDELWATIVQQRIDGSFGDGLERMYAEGGELSFLGRDEMSRWDMIAESLSYGVDWDDWVDENESPGNPVGLGDVLAHERDRLPHGDRGPVRRRPRPRRHQLGRPQQPPLRRQASRVLPGRRPVPVLGGLIYGESLRRPERRHPRS